MKSKFFIPLIAATLFCGTLFSQSTVSLTFFDGRPFSVDLDGKDYGYFQEEFYAELGGGKYHVKIFDGVRASLKPVFEGDIEIPYKSSTFAYINSDFRYEVYKQYFHNDRRRICECDCEYCKNCVHKTHEGRRYNDTDNREYMSDKDFSELLRNVNSIAFDDNKKEMIKMALENNYVSAEQVKILLSAVTFENTKLEIAKYAYGKTVDKENYYKILTAFIFENTIQDLKEFINKQK